MLPESLTELPRPGPPWGTPGCGLGSRAQRSGPGPRAAQVRVTRAPPGASTARQRLKQTPLLFKPNSAPPHVAPAFYTVSLSLRLQQSFSPQRPGIHNPDICLGLRLIHPPGVRRRRGSVCQASATAHNSFSPPIKHCFLWEDTPSHIHGPSFLAHMSRTDTHLPRTYCLQHRLRS